MESDEEPQHEDGGLLSRELILSSLAHEVSRVMHSATRLDLALNVFLLGITEMTGAENMVLFGIKQGQAGLEALQSVGLSGERLAGLKPTLAHNSIYNCVASHRHILVGELSPEDPFAIPGVASYMVLPITARLAEAGPDGASHIEPLGVLWMDTSPPCPELTAQVISHLSGLCQQAGMLMETFRVHRELATANAELKTSNTRLNDAYAALSKAQKRIEADLDRARAIQNSLLPSAFPTRVLRRAAGKYIPAGKVGGDYYDCFELEPGVLGMVVADVSGHGIAAALVMSMFKALLRNFTSLDRSPAAVLDRINRTFLNQFGGAHFVTAFYALFDQGSRRLTWCNAGHVAQYLLQYPPEFPAAADPVVPGQAPEPPAELVELASQGLVLGIFPDTFIRDATLDLAPAARLFLYTDGITEAHGDGGRMFGHEPLRELAVSHRGEHPAAVIDELLKAREAFLNAAGNLENGSRPFEDLSDDATLVILDL